MLYFKASASKGVPSWNCTSSRKLKVHSSAFSDDSQLVAKAGWNSPSGPNINSGSAMKESINHAG